MRTRTLCFSVSQARSSALSAMFGRCSASHLRRIAITSAGSMAASALSMMPSSGACSFPIE